MENRATILVFHFSCNRRAQVLRLHWQPSGAHLHLLKLVRNWLYLCANCYECRVSIEIIIESTQCKSVVDWPVIWKKTLYQLSAVKKRDDDPAWKAVWLSDLSLMYWKGRFVTLGEKLLDSFLKLVGIHR